jgi:hypothetical protein
MSNEQNIFPDLCDINLTNNTSTLLTSTKNYIKIMDLYPGEVMISQLYSQYNQSELDSIPKFFTGLNNNTVQLPEDSTDSSTKIGFDNFTAQFRLYWLEKFWRQHDEVKESVCKVLGSDNIYFTNFSECIGSLAANIEFIKTNSTLNWYNTENDIEYTIPVISHNKISDNSKIINLYLSKLTNNLLKTNMLNIAKPYINDFGGPGLGTHQSTPQTSDDPHGVDLVSDTEYYKQVKSIIDLLKSPIQELLKGLYDVLLFVRKSRNVTYAPPVELDISVEGEWQVITLLKHRIESTATLNRNNNIIG